jgi:hypothetical protein
MIPKVKSRNPGRVAADIYEQFFKASEGMLLPQL